jgi:NAD(P)-dependent dehydrogenase (short-subunit alcohol dehydrogenase family)
MDKFNLDQRIILLTGSTGHLGQAIAESLTRAHAHVVIGGRSDDKLKGLKSKLLAAGGTISVLPFDIEVETERKRAIDFIASQLGRLDGIVNNAYSGKTGTVENSTVADFEKATTFNLSAPFQLIQLAMPLLKEAGVRNRGGASIVNVASMYGSVSPDPRIYGSSGSNNPPFYGATKAGLIQLTRYLACHLADSNIRVNAVSPGAIPPASIRYQNPEFHNELCGKAPLGRIGLPHEVAEPIVFLLGDAASYITGVNLPIDGGWTAW